MNDGTERYTIIKWCSCPSGVHHHREGRWKNVRGRAASCVRFALGDRKDGRQALPVLLEGGFPVRHRAGEHIGVICSLVSRFSHKPRLKNADNVVRIREIIVLVHQVSRTMGFRGCFTGRDRRRQERGGQERPHPVLSRPAPAVPPASEVQEGRRGAVLEGAAGVTGATHTWLQQAAHYFIS